MTIVHLISDQTLQNVLPVAAFQPNRIIQINSAHPQFQDISENTANACRMVLRMGSAKIENHIIDHPQPTFHDCLVRIRGVLSSAGIDSGRFLINLTGGSKPMSLAAFQAAREMHWETLYCDTGRREFTTTPVGTADTASLPGFEEAAAMLNVTTVLAAYGKQSGKDWKSSRDLTPQAAMFGRAAFELRKQCNAAIAAFVEGTLRPAFHGTSGRKKFLEKGRLKAAVVRPFPEVESGPVTDYLELAKIAGRVTHNREGWFFAAAPDLPVKELKSQVNGAFNDLSGLWLEYYCHDILLQSQRFNDIHANVEPVGLTDFSDFGETDFICFDTKSISIALISCKAENPKLEHIESVKSRSQELGGRHAAAVICSFVPDKSAEEIALLVLRARRMGVTLVCNEAIEPFLLGET